MNGRQDGLEWDDVHFLRTCSVALGACAGIRVQREDTMNNAYRLGHCFAWDREKVSLPLTSVFRPMFDFLTTLLMDNSTASLECAQRTTLLPFSFSIPTRLLFHSPNSAKDLINSSWLLRAFSIRMRDSSCHRRDFSIFLRSSSSTQRLWFAKFSAS